MHAGEMPPHYYSPEQGHTEHSRCGYTYAGWYFWDETEAFVCGPYTSLEEASQAQDTYIP